MEDETYSNQPPNHHWLRTIAHLLLPQYIIIWDGENSILG
jgi:hypothetical protein